MWLYSNIIFGLRMLSRKPYSFLWSCLWNFDSCKRQYFVPSEEQLKWKDSSLKKKLWSSETTRKLSGNILHSFTGGKGMAEEFSACGTQAFQTLFQMIFLTRAWVKLLSWAVSQGITVLLSNSLSFKTLAPNLEISEVQWCARAHGFIPSYFNLPFWFVSSLFHKCLSSFSLFKGL